MTRFRYSDREQVGRSDVVPFRHCEPAKARHDRRKRTAEDLGDRILAWCHSRNITLEIKNDFHHWVFTVGQKKAEWWPSTAKLVLNRDYNNGIHAHDWKQVVKVLSERWI